MAAFFGIWLWVSTLLPHADVPLRALVPGAILMAVGAQIVHLFTVYVAVKLERSLRSTGARDGRDLPVRPLRRGTPRDRLADAERGALAQGGGGVTWVKEHGG